MTTTDGQTITADQTRLIQQNVRQVTHNISAALAAVGRPPGSARLLAVSKRQPVAAIEAAYQAGLTHFGENYVQEAVPKIEALAHLPLHWHFIGPLQSNKTQAVAEHFDWVHSVSRAKIARRLSDQRNVGDRRREPLNLCLQVNIDQDPNKAGIGYDQAAELLHDVQGLKNLRVRGLMTILDQRTPPKAGFDRLAALFHRLACELNAAERADWDTLSMGMSGDYGEAIEAGATLIRIGTALFGARPPAGQ